VLISAGGELLLKKFWVGSVEGFVSRGFTTNAATTVAAALLTIHFVRRFIVTGAEMILYITRLRNKKGSRSTA
jgi:hypothetical protein